MNKYKGTLFSMEDMQAEWKAEKEWFKKHPIKAWFIRRYRDIRSFVYNIPDMPYDGFRKCKRGYQRAYRGWADEDLWNFHGYLSNIIYNGLVQLKATQHTYVCTLGHDNETHNAEAEEKAWNAILDEMIDAFKVARQINLSEREHYMPEILKRDPKFAKEINMLSKEEQEKMEKGMHLFIKYYFSLWD